MKALFIREVSSEEKKVLQKGLHSTEAFTRSLHCAPMPNLVEQCGGKNTNPDCI